MDTQDLSVHKSTHTGCYSHGKLDAARCWCPSLIGQGLDWYLTSHGCAEKKPTETGFIICPQGLFRGPNADLSFPLLPLFSY